MTTPNRGSPGLELPGQLEELDQTPAGTMRSPVKPSRDCECRSCVALYAGRDNGYLAQAREAYREHSGQI